MAELGVSPQPEPDGPEAETGGRMLVSGSIRIPDGPGGYIVNVMLPMEALNGVLIGGRAINLALPEQQGATDADAMIVDVGENRVERGIIRDAIRPRLALTINGMDGDGDVGQTKRSPIWQPFMAEFRIGEQDAIAEEVDIGEPCSLDCAIGICLQGFGDGFRIASRLAAAGQGEGPAAMSGGELDGGLVVFPIKRVIGAFSGLFAQIFGGAKFAVAVASPIADQGGD